ncbi:MAG TPA: DinB family protein [Gemmatimonadales bacterium]|jgi:uncharacterized damage-inducible protein DinB|nr:DinB family protein [Gemmatimonadales bacterium]
MTTPSHPSPTTPAYVADTMRILGDLDPLTVLAETPSWLLDRLGGLELDVLRTPEAPGKWSLTQVLAHLADVEIAMGWRARILLTQENAPLHGFDEGAWMERFDGANADPTEAMLAFGTLRAWNLPVWTRVSDADLARTGIHSERGPETFDTLRRMVAGHDLRHRRQVERILAGLG